MPTATDTNGAAPASEARAAVVRSAPKLVPPVEILLDRPRTLVMDFAAMEAFEGVTGLSAWSREAWDGNPKNIVALIWASLLHADPDLDIEVVKRWPCMTLANFSYLQDRLGDLWGATMPEPDEADAASTEGASDDPNPRRRAG